MKLLLSIVVFLLSLSHSVFSQTDTILVDIDTLSDAEAADLGYRNYRIPSKINIRNYEVQGTIYKTIKSDEFFSIGFSEDGKYAYAIEPYAENCDCYFVEFYIVDLANNNEVLYFNHYDNEAWERAWDEANSSQKDSLREVHRCGYMKCAWYQVYNELSEEMFKHGIKQLKQSYYRDNDLLKDEMYQAIESDSMNRNYSLEWFFEHDTDTIKYEYAAKDSIVGLNYHGYVSNPEFSDWRAFVLSERHLGLDTSKTEVWHYKVTGFKRSQDLPYSRNSLFGLEAHKKLNARIERPYRKISLVEQMYDRVVNVEMRQWLLKYKRNLDVTYHDNKDGIFPYTRNYGRNESDFREHFSKDGKEFQLDRSFVSESGEYYVYGLEQPDENVNELTQLIHYNTDSGEVDMWYDFSNELKHDHGGIRFVHEEDSLIYVSVGSDFTDKDVVHYGRIYCIHKTDHVIYWISDKFTANAESFVMINDVLVCGYAASENGKNQKDKLYLINKLNGETVKDITLPDSPVWLVKDDNRVFVKTPVSVHEFDIKGSFFETF